MDEIERGRRTICVLFCAKSWRISPQLTCNILGAWPGSFATTIERSDTSDQTIPYVEEATRSSDERKIRRVEKELCGQRGRTTNSEEEATSAYEKKAKFPQRSESVFPYERQLLILSVIVCL